jgi:hypothetical protein
MTTPTGPGITTPPTTPSFFDPARSPSPVGQNLSPKPNVFAPAGFGGDRWGANGGDQVAVGGGVTDQTGYVKSVMVAVADGELATNFLPAQQFTQQYNTVLAQESTGTIAGQNSQPGQLGPGAGTYAG